MKKILSIVLAAVLVLSIFAGCSAKTDDKNDDAKLSVVATIFPIYDWVKNVAGEDVHLDLTLLLNNGADLHNYQPTADDIIKISTCDVFIYVGGESDEWVDDTLKSAQNKNMKVLNLMDVLGDSAKEEEIVEGMQEEEHEHEEGEHEEGEEEEGPEYDEHVWLSLNNAEKCVDAVAKTFAEVDEADASSYYANAKTYNESLASLDVKYGEAVKNAKNKTLIFGDRFPFRYLTDDYGLKYYAAFVGCSAESEASFETVSFLANKVDELKLKYVMTIDGSDKKLANTIIDSTKSKNQKILTLDSMQSISESDIESGITYLSVMESNLSVLQEALS